MMFCDNEFTTKAREVKAFCEAPLFGRDFEEFYFVRIL